MEQLHSGGTFNVKELAEKEIFSTGIVSQGVVLGAEDNFVRILCFPFVPSTGPGSGYVWY